MRSFRPAARLLTLTLLTQLTPLSANAAGFYISDVGALGMSRGGAFIAAPDSLTAIHYNPAALTLLGRGLHVQLDTQIVKLSSDFTRTCPCLSAQNLDPGAFEGAGDPARQATARADAAARDADLARTFRPATNSADPQIIPNLWAAYGFDWNKLTVGAGAWAITSPGRAKYGDIATAARQAQRYSLIELNLFELFVVGSAAIEPIEGLRFGLSVGGYQFHVRQAVSLWANTNLTDEAENTALDIATEISFSAPIRMMWNAGISYTPTFLPRLSIGVSALSKRSVRAPGTAEIKAPQLLLDVGGSITGNEIEVEVNLPPTFRFGVQWDEPDLFEAEAAVVIEGWGVYKEITIRPQNIVVDVSGNNPQPLDTIHFETAFEDTYSIRVGGELKMFEPYLGIHAGYFYEPTATPIRLLDVSQPDLTKHGFTLGLSTAWSGVTLDVGLALIVMPELVITDSQRTMIGPLPPPDGDNRLLTTIGNGKYSGSYIIGGASIGVVFDELFADERVAPVPEKGLASPSGEG